MRRQGGKIGDEIEVQRWMTSGNQIVCYLSMARRLGCRRTTHMTTDTCLGQDNVVVEASVPELLMIVQRTPPPIFVGVIFEPIASTTVARLATNSEHQLLTRAGRGSVT